MNSLSADRLYALLPAVQRIRDAEQGQPLRALIGALAQELEALEENLEQLYDDQFIETCQDWVAPYIGDLVGYRTLHGLSSHGFPNWFTIGINQNGLSPNMTAMFDDQAVHVAHIIDTVKARGMRVIEATADAEEAWIKQIVALAGFGAQAFLEACTPGYYNREGKSAAANMQNSPYAPGINAFNALLKDWRDADTLDGMTIG